jgi:hypothetical protein
VRLGLAAGLALAIALVGCGTDIQGTRLTIRTAGFQVAPGSCPTGLAAPMRIERAGEEMIFVDVASGARLSVTWPFGFAAWVEHGIAVLYATDGSVVGREGDVLDNIGGGTAEDGGIRVCAVGVRTYS